MEDSWGACVSSAGASASRACLLTGQYGHNNGMMGLAHRGWSLKDYRQHLVHPLHDAGYHSVLIGEQHIAIAGVSGEEVAGNVVELIDVGGVGGVNVVHELGPALESVFTG